MTDKADDVVAWDMMEAIGFAMLVTHDGADGGLRARPMSAQVKPDENAIYFLTDARNQKDDELLRNDNVCVAFADTSGSNYVSVSGVASVSGDADKIAELWSPAAKIWWESKDDPNIRVLRITPTQAEFWKGSGAIVTSVKFVAALVTGKRPELGTNRKVSL